MLVGLHATEQMATVGIVLVWHGQAGDQKGACLLPNLIRLGNCGIPAPNQLDVDDSPTGERNALVDVAGRAQEVTDLVKGSAEAIG